jgi:hypothetical protein
MQPTVRLFSVAIAVATSIIATSGCGGGGAPVSPASPSATQKTTLTFLSADGDVPVAGATVTILGTTYQTNAAGEIAVDGTPPLYSPIRVTADSFFVRIAAFGGPEGRVFRLWPLGPPTGMGIEFMRALIYGDGGRQVFMWRVPAQVYVSPSVEIQNDEAAMSAIRTAADAVRDVTGGLVTFSVVTTLPSSGHYITLAIDPSVNGIADVGGPGSLESGTCYRHTGGVRYHNLANARMPNIALHEFGHLLGLGDLYRFVVPGQENDLMNLDNGITKTFSARERLAIKFLYTYRRAGNRYPDTDPELPQSIDGTRPCSFYQ